MSSCESLGSTWMRKVHGIRPVHLVVCSNGCIRLLFLLTKNLSSFMMRVTSTKFKSSRHIEEGFI